MNVSDWGPGLGVLGAPLRIMMRVARTPQHVDPFLSVRFPGSPAGGSGGEFPGQ
jgi:hypothetical protein